MPVCQVCQKDNPQGVEYCEDCGAALTPASEPATVGTTAGKGSSAGASQATPTTAGSASPSPAPTTPQASTPPGPQAATPAAEAASTGQPSAGPAAGTSGPEAAPASAPASEPAVPSAADAQERPRLQVKRYGAMTGDEVPLQGERLMLGRFDPETGPVDIDLSAAPEAEHISRQHAELYREADGRWFVRDLGSTNGVFVKGAGQAGFGPRITEPRAIADGDELAFGNARFIFRSA